MIRRYHKFEVIRALNNVGQLNLKVCSRRDSDALFSRLTGLDRNPMGECEHALGGIFLYTRSTAPQVFSRTKLMIE